MVLVCFRYRRLWLGLYRRGIRDVSPPWLGVSYDGGLFLVWRSDRRCILGLRSGLCDCGPPTNKSPPGALCLLSLLSGGCGLGIRTGRWRGIYKAPCWFRVDIDFGTAYLWSQL